MESQGGRAFRAGIWTRGGPGVGRGGSKNLDDWGSTRLRIRHLGTWGCTCCGGPGRRGRSEGGRDPVGGRRAEGLGAGALGRCGAVPASEEVWQVEDFGKSTKVGAWETRPKRHPLGRRGKGTPWLEMRASGSAEQGGEQFAWARARERKGTTPESRELRKARK